jgi:hypothetical protein
MAQYAFDSLKPNGDEEFEEIKYLYQQLQELQFLKEQQCYTCIDALIKQVPEEDWVKQYGFPAEMYDRVWRFVNKPHENPILVPKHLLADLAFLVLKSGGCIAGGIQLPGMPPQNVMLQTKDHRKYVHIEGPILDAVREYYPEQLGIRNQKPAKKETSQSSGPYMPDIKRGFFNKKN